MAKQCCSAQTIKWQEHPVAAASEVNPRVIVTYSPGEQPPSDLPGHFGSIPPTTAERFPTARNLCILPSAEKRFFIHLQEPERSRCRFPVQGLRTEVFDLKVVSRRRKTIRIPTPLPTGRGSGLKAQNDAMVVGCYKV